MLIDGIESDTYGSLGMVQLDTPSQASLGQQAQLGDHELIKLPVFSVS